MRATHDKDKAGSDTRRCPMQTAAQADGCGSEIDAHAIDEIAAASIRLGAGEGAYTGVLLVNHGSHSATWRRMLLDVHAEVRDDLLALPGVKGVRTAFMEYTEPSIATQLEAFDRDGVDRVILVPLLLTVSGHSFDDIPTIYGAKSEARSVAALEAEGIARYSPDAEVVMTPLLDYPKLVRENMTRRIRSLRHDHAASSRTPTRDGVVLVGYGSEEFNAAWETFFEELCDVARRELDMAAAQYCWCGHLVRYTKDPTVTAINDVLKSADRAIVIPLLLAFDELFQDKIIGGAVKKIGRPDRVLYRHDSILPEPEVSRWVVDIVKTTLPRSTARSEPDANMVRSMRDSNGGS